jgi:hypothetical protein
VNRAWAVGWRWRGSGMVVENVSGFDDADRTTEDAEDTEGEAIGLMVYFEIIIIIIIIIIL